MPTYTCLPFLRSAVNLHARLSRPMFVPEVSERLGGRERICCDRGRTERGILSHQLLRGTPALTVQRVCVYVIHHDAREISSWASDCSLVHTYGASHVCQQPIIIIHASKHGIRGGGWHNQRIKIVCYVCMCVCMYAAMSDGRTASSSLTTSYEQDRDACVSHTAWPSRHTTLISALQQRQATTRVPRPVIQYQDLNGLPNRDGGLLHTGIYKYLLFVN